MFALNCMPAHFQELYLIFNKISALFIAITWRPSSVVGNFFTFQASSGIKNRNLVMDIPMIIRLHFGFSQFISFREEDLWNFSQSEHIIGPGSHIEYPTLKLLHWLNLNCASIIGRSFTNFVIFMLIVIPRWLPLQDIVFT
jgi:hypothetical protein